MMVTAIEQERVTPAERDREAMERVARLLAADDADSLALVGGDGVPVPLPQAVVRTLRQVVTHLARDRAVSVVPVDKELTTQQAADLLNVSRPYLVRLLEDGTIPFTHVGTHRRVRLDDLLAFKRTRDEERETALDRLTELNQALGLYDDE